jgi:hypothetical protein
MTNESIVLDKSRADITIDSPVNQQDGPKAKRAKGKRITS